MHKPFSESCVQNRTAIFSVLEPRVRACRSLLEIGSGTGQHAVYFAAQLPQLIWQTSDMRDNHPGIEAWLDESRLENARPPLALDVLNDPWPEELFDTVFSANTAHIMPERAVAAMFRGVGSVLGAGGLFLLYGPFNYGGRFTAPSNASFDQWLKQRDPAMGVRDVDWLTVLAESAGMMLSEDLEMPANNRTLVWQRSG